MTTAERTVPYNLDAEAAVLGALLIDPDAYHEVGDALDERDFYRTTHRDVYHAIAQLARDARTVDVVTVSAVLEGRGQGDTTTLLPLLQSAPSSLRIVEHAAIVRAAAQRRRLIDAASKIATAAYDEARPIDAVLSSAEQSVADVTDAVATTNVMRADRAARDLLDFVEARRDAGGAIDGLLTGFVDLDRLFEGLKEDELTVVAARPGMGKTAFAHGVALHTAKRGEGVALFSLEMSTRQTMLRLVAIETGIPLQKIARGNLTDAEHVAFVEAIGRLSTLPLYIDDTSSLTPTQLHAKCRRLDARYGLSLVIVDYLGLMEVDRPTANRVDEVSEISRSLKQLSKRLHVHVVALSQLNRAVEARADKRPQLSDLRDSGSVEQDADAVAFIYRDEYYAPDTTLEPNVAEVHVAKHRNGPTGVVKLHWSGELTRFANLQLQPVNLGSAGVYRANGKSNGVHAHANSNGRH